MAATASGFFNDTAEQASGDMVPEAGHFIQAARMVQSKERHVQPPPGKTSPPGCRDKYDLDSGPFAEYFTQTGSQTPFGKTKV
jgi:hypothetical protein